MVFGEDFENACYLTTEEIKKPKFLDYTFYKPNPRDSLPNFDLFLKNKRNSWLAEKSQSHEIKPSMFSKINQHSKQNSSSYIKQNVSNNSSDFKNEDKKLSQNEYNYGMKHDNNSDKNLNLSEDFSTKLSQNLSTEKRNSNFFVANSSYTKKINETNDLNNSRGSNNGVAFYVGKTLHKNSSTTLIDNLKEKFDRNSISNK